MRDIFDIQMPSLLDDDLDATESNYRQTRISALVNFTASRLDDGVRVLVRGDGQRVDLRFNEAQARALAAELDRVSDRRPRPHREVRR